MKSLRKFVAYVVLPVSAVLVSAIFWTIASPKTDSMADVQTGFPTHLSKRVQLRPGEEMRLVDYAAPDSDVRLDALVIEQNHETADIKYSPKDGSLEATVYFATKAETEKKRVKRVVSFGPDARTKVHDLQYWESGALKVKGDRISATEFEESRFWENGTSEKAHLLFAKTTEPGQPQWNIKREEDYFPNGTTAKLVVRQPDNSLVTEEYNTDHIVVSHEVLNSTQTERKIEKFLDDGKTLELRIGQTWNTTIEIFDAGKLAEKQEFSLGFSTYTDTLYGAKGNPSEVRSWSLKDLNEPRVRAGNPTIADFNLTDVVLNNEDGQAIQEWHFNHGRLWMLETPDPNKDAPSGAMIVQIYHEDGSLSRTVQYSSGTKSRESVDYPEGGKNVLPAVDPKLTEAKPFVAPPALLPKAHPPIMYMPGGF